MLTATVVSEWLTIADLGELLQLSLTALERLKAAGKLPPHVELSRRSHRWRRTDVEAWLQDRLDEAAHEQARTRR